MGRASWCRWTRDGSGVIEGRAQAAVRVTNVPADDFERQVKSDTPPTVTKLADQGGKEADRSGHREAVSASSSPSDFLARFSTKHEKITFVQLSELCCVPLHRHRPQDRLSAATVIGRLT